MGLWMGLKEREESLHQIKGSFFAFPEHNIRYIRSPPSVREGASVPWIHIGINNNLREQAQRMIQSSLHKIYPQASCPLLSYTLFSRRYIIHLAALGIRLYCNWKVRLESNIGQSEVNSIRNKRKSCCDHLTNQFSTDVILSSVPLFVLKSLEEKCFVCTRRWCSKDKGSCDVFKHYARKSSSACPKYMYFRRGL